MFSFVINEYYIYEPYAVITASIIPYLVLPNSTKKRILYLYIAFFGAVLLLTNYLNLMVDDQSITIKPIINDFIEYYFISQVSMFLFIQLSFLYFKNKNRDFEYNLKQKNKKLEELKQEIEKYNSELKKTLDKLNNSKQQLIQSDKMASLGILTAGVAHEINNPLNFIKSGLASLYITIENIGNFSNLNELTEKQKFIIDKIELGADKVTEIVRSLNDFSRNNDSKHAPCNLCSIIDNCLMILNSSIKGRIKIIKNYRKNELTINCNEGRMHQVFLNLLSNSQQAIKDKGEITISITSEKSLLNITIEDSGEGISSKNIDKIFDPFFTTKETGKGTGLGLSIVYNIIKDHGGNITVNSKQGKGTIFSISLPLN
jgi:signal transduction histidine kinase